MSLRSRGYGQVTLPLKLINKIKEFAAENEDLGYNSVPSVVKAAVREFFYKYGGDSNSQ